MGAAKTNCTVHHRKFVEVNCGIDGFWVRHLCSGRRGSVNARRPVFYTGSDSRVYS
jgi:hypothetical protein